MRDRERRWRSVIIRGVPNTDVTGVRNIFQAVSNLLVTKDIVIENLQCTDQAKGFYRANIPNDDDRCLLLNQTKRLKEHESYKTVYIHRDLTYTQRQEWFRRREAARNNAASASAQHSAQGSNSNPTTVETHNPPVAPFQ